MSAPEVVLATAPGTRLDRDDRPLVVLLHGRGSDEQQILPLAAALPGGLDVVAVRAPIAEGGGYAWFANRGIGRPVPASLRLHLDWFREWLDALPRRRVVLVGFSGGAAFAGGLVLDDPTRFAGVAVLHGTLPFDAGLPVEPGALDGVEVLVSRGARDAVIPGDLLDRTWHHLADGVSGARVTSHLDPGGHELTPATVAVLAAWLARIATGGER
ncbi:hypothetical protein GCM10022215_31370 [Nocardioides fonticola]|uniref:Phospholipase/carboxylesterase/thioesterase domain-containing protein n=1 Tax=Nocardioides fonticola TaxID=450363 RepID=A0ABP7XQQ7_9ACTN